MKITFALLIGLICLQPLAFDAHNELGRTSKPNQPPMIHLTKIKITVGTRHFTATCYTNATATAFSAQLPMTITMTELNGNEKYGDLPKALPTNASNPGTIENGDLMLYGSGTLVLFYKTFSTSYNYTRIGRIENPSGLAAALGSGNAKVTFEAE